jgi:hypothetical protein
VSYLTQGAFALREGTMTGFPPGEGGVLLSWGLWQIPDAENDEEWLDPEPESA